MEEPEPTYSWEAQIPSSMGGIAWGGHVLVGSWAGSREEQINKWFDYLLSSVLGLLSSFTQ